MQSCRDKLVEDNLRLVYYIFNKLHKTHLTIRYKEDLISEGMLGLVKAANSFDEGLGNRFSTYATMCIRNQMLMFIRKANKFMAVEVSLNAPISNDSQGNELYLADILEDTTNSMDGYLTVLDINEAVTKLKPKEQELLRLHQDGYKQKEIAKMQSQSQSYISRLIRNLMEKLITSCQIVQ